MNKVNFVKKMQHNHPDSNNAAGRQRRKILTQILAPSTDAFLQKNNFKNGMKGLDLGCGTGEVTIQLAALVGPEGKMTGMDIDATNIKIAQEKAALQKTPPRLLPKPGPPAPLQESYISRDRR